MGPQSSNDLGKPRMALGRDPPLQLHSFTNAPRFAPPGSPRITITGKTSRSFRGWTRYRRFLNWGSGFYNIQHRAFFPSMRGRFRFFFFFFFFLFFFFVFICFFFFFCAKIEVRTTAEEGGL